MTGICRPVSKEAVRSPSAAARPPSPQGGGSGSIGRGLNSMSAARLPPKSATTKIRCLRASLREPAQYWASMSRQHTSGVPPRTIPAFPHLPEGGIGKQSDNDLGNPLAGYRAVRVSFEAYPLRKIDALLPQGSLRNYQKHPHFDYEKDVQGIYGNDSEQIVR